jgi:hypothetical protein
VCDGTKKLTFFYALFILCYELQRMTTGAETIGINFTLCSLFRIFKLVRHFAGLQSLIYTLKQAYKELGLLFLLVAVAILTVGILFSR